MNNLQKTINENRGSVIHLDDKQYFLNETVILNHIEKPLKIVGHNTTVTSGMILPNWIRRDNLFVHEAKGIPYTNMMYKNGQLIDRPHTEFIHSTGWELYKDDAFDFHLEKEHHGKKYYDGYLSTRTEMQSWANHQTLEFIYDAGWTHCVCPVESIEKVDEKTVFIKMVQPCFRDCQIKEGMQINSPNQIYNCREKLQEGQWYFDQQNHEIIYMPFRDEEITSLTFIIPTLETLFMIENSHDISFEGITFQYTSWIKPSVEGLPDGQANLCKNFDIRPDQMTEFRKPESAVKIRNSTRISFTDCRFLNLGCCAIDIQEGAKHVDISRCRFSNIAANGIMASEFNFKCGHETDEKLITEHITISDNEFFQIGSQYKSGTAIIAGYLRHSTISHNIIHEVAYTGISLGWGWGFDDPNYKYSDLKHDRLTFGTFDDYPIMTDNHIDYNHIYHTMTKMHDGAAIYTLSMNQESSVKGNYVHDNGNFTGVPYPELFFFRRIPDLDNPVKTAIIERNSFPGGIYLDEGSGGFTVEDNVIARVACPLYYHYTGIKGVFETNTYRNNFISDEISQDALKIIEEAGVRI
ncbi:MAG: right-handed parallel beta-helix repeat-containing protein [Clostridia bacterium]|nr:right-handed parallel beta-helix repeat-containing protein [Clostridia bacterium]